MIPQYIPKGLDELEILKKSTEAKTYYVETVANGGDDSNDGSVGSPFLTIQKAIDSLAMVHHDVDIQVGEGDFEGFYVGDLSGAFYVGSGSLPEFKQPFNHIRIKGTTEVTYSGTASGGGVASDGRMYFDKPISDPDYTPNEFVGLRVDKIGGKGPSTYPYVVENTTNRVYLSLSDPISFFVPDNTFEFQLVDVKTKIRYMSPALDSDLLFDALVFVQNNYFRIELTDIKFEPDASIATAYGFYGNYLNNIYFNRCVFNNANNNMDYAISAFFVTHFYFSGCLFKDCGSAQHNLVVFVWPIGFVYTYYSCFLNTANNVECVYVYGGSGILASNLFADHNGNGSSLLRLYTPYAFISNCASHNSPSYYGVRMAFNGGRMQINSLRIHNHMIGLDLANDGRGYVVNFDGTSTFSDCGKSGIAARQSTLIMEGNIQGSGNAEYGIDLIDGSELVLQGAATITGILGEVRVGEGEVRQFSEFPNSGDSLFNLASNSRISRI